MLKSMTGFGRGEVVVGGKRVTVEIKSVNHRYSEVAALAAGLLGSGRKIRHNCRLKLPGPRRFHQRCTGKIYVGRVDKELAIAYHKSLEK